MRHGFSSATHFFRQRLTLANYFCDNEGMNEHKTSLVAILKKVCRVFCAVAVAVGAFALLGWILDNERLKCVVPGLVAMNPMTATAFILSGIALCILRDEPTDEDRKMRRIAQVCTAIVLIIGLLKLLELVTGWHIGVDRLLFHDKLEVLQNGKPNRMAPNTALNFSLLGAALLLLDWRAKSSSTSTPNAARALPSQLIAILGASASLLALVGYAYGAKSFYGVGSFIPMALHTAFTFVLLLCGVLFARGDQGLMAVPSSDSAGGAMARLLIPAAIGIPFILGWLRMAGQRAGLYDTEVGLSLFVVLTMMAFSALIWRNAVALYHTDMARRAAAEELALSHVEMSKRNAEMEADLNLAREIQQAFLPQQYVSFPRVTLPLEGALQFHHRYQPTSTLGGDFTDILVLSDTKAGVFICDVMGHGVRSALVTAVARGLIEELLPTTLEPGRFLSQLNRSLMAILSRTKTPMFASAFFLIADVESGAMWYANAGHPSPLHMRREAGTVEMLLHAVDGAGPALGVMEDFEYSSFECPLSERDLILLFTDGLVEVMRGEDEYGEERLLESVQRRVQMSATPLLDELIAEIKDFSDDKFFEDDVCLVGMEVIRTHVPEQVAS
jgi:serine phosphatase RsbU (regulator of sigma subunit)